MRSLSIRNLKFFWGRTPRPPSIGRTSAASMPPLFSSNPTFAPLPKNTKRNPVFPYHVHCTRAHPTSANTHECKSSVRALMRYEKEGRKKQASSTCTCTCTCTMNIYLHIYFHVHLLQAYMYLKGAQRGGTTSQRFQRTHVTIIIIM